jgi:ATP-dependent Lhr-like helicase
MSRRRSVAAPVRGDRPPGLSGQTWRSVPTVKDWFASRGWTPFPFQREVWSAYARGESGLIHAPTGTGKTLAAFLGPAAEAIADGATGKDTPLRVLWITPLRALAADTTHSLQDVCDGLGLDWTVETRTADTKASVRNRQRKRLPPVLVTTPESLSLFLTRDDGPGLFAGLRAVIVDEWHELLSSKRGAQTELAVARLRRWRPGVRTWGLSATLGNLDVACEALLGVGNTGRIVTGRLPKETVIDSVLPRIITRFPWAGHLGLSLLPQVVAEIEESESCLVFTNTRSQTELWYQAILQARPDWAGIIALHHGSLDRSVRGFVEEALADGRLKCVVCTSSLDLGVDFSPVDRVLQVGSPKGVARLLQRAGRSGHRPGGVSRVTFVPTNALELIEVAAARAAAAAGRIEGREPADKPLDVLAQHAVTVALGGGFDAVELYDEVRSTRAYRDLSPAEWDWVLDFVTRGGETLRAYPEYRRVEVIDGVYRMTDPRVARRHRMSLGTITSDAAVQVRFLRGGRLGTVEESFAARLRPGDRFLFAGRTLEFVRLHELTVWVRLARKPGKTVPRWMGGRLPLSGELAAAVREQLDEARRRRFDGPEMQTVRPLLELQARRSRLPAPDELLIERLRSREGHHLFVYPFEGRLVHEGLAALTAFRLSRLAPLSFTAAMNDYGFELLCPTPIPLDEALAEGLFTPDALADDILASLNAAELARRQFREIARVAGLVFPGMPGAAKSAKQLQASTGLLYNVFREYDPGNLLLHQARREVLDRQLEQSRLRRTLERITTSRVTVVDVDRPTPLGFPLLVERYRESVSSEKLADRLQRMTLDLERE